MTTEFDAALDRIRKLMRLSTDSAASEHEVANALGAARRIMERYSIAEDQVILEQEDGTEKLYQTVTEEDIYSRVGRIDRFDTSLAFSIAMLFGCKGILMTIPVPSSRDKTKFRPGEMMRFIGIQRDVAIARTVFIEVLATGRAISRMHYGSKWNNQHNSFMQGFATRVGQRVREVITQTASNCTAIITAKDAIVARKFVELHPHTRAIKVRTSKIDSSAYYKGNDAGANVSLSSRGLSGRKASPQKGNLLS